MPVFMSWSSSWPMRSLAMVLRSSVDSTPICTNRYSSWVLFISCTHCTASCWDTGVVLIISDMHLWLPLTSCCFTKNIQLGQWTVKFKQTKRVFLLSEEGSSKNLFSHSSVYLHVVDVEVLLDDGCGLLGQFILTHGRLCGTLWRWGGDSCLPLRCSHVRKIKLETFVFTGGFFLKKQNNCFCECASQIS